MVAFNFQASFAPAIRSGSKVQTVRQKRRCSAGQEMQLFTGMRTKQCELVKRAECGVSDYVHIAPDGLILGDVSKHPRNIDEFARLDGFASFDAMLAWFQERYGQPHFIGHVHRWVL